MALGQVPPSPDPLALCNDGWGRGAGLGGCSEDVGTSQASEPLWGWHLHTLVSGGGTYEVPDGPSSWAKGVRAVALGLALWPTGCVSGFEGVQASCLSLMVPRHTCATADEGGRWEPPARLSFPTRGWTRPLALKHSSPFRQKLAPKRGTWNSYTGSWKDAPHYVIRYVRQGPDGTVPS